MTADITQDISRHKFHVEALFCATVLVNAEGPRRRCGWLSPDAFSDKRMGRYWQQVLDGIEPSKAAIAAEVYNDLLRAQTGFISSMEFESFAQSIADDAYYLSLSKTLPGLASSISERDMAKIRQTVGDMHAGTPNVGAGVPDGCDISGEFITSLDHESSAIQTGYSEIDRWTGGIDRQTLTLLAARPGMGKSTMALNLAHNFAKDGARVLFFGLEMARKQLWGRLVFGRAGIDSRLQRANKLSAEQKAALVAASTAIMEEVETRLMIEDNSRMTSEDMWRKAADIRPDVIIVDHLSLVADRGDNEVLRLGNISWMGKIMAKELDAVSIYCMQLNRGVETRTDRRPLLSDLRGSGELEQNADNVLFIYRPDYYNGDNKDISETDLIIAKYREGVSGGTLKFQFNKKAQRFYCEARLP
jgi:KaiC/GvpD/RAD55 family RecA-like ATPase